MRRGRRARHRLASEGAAGHADAAQTEYTNGEILHGPDATITVKAWFVDVNEHIAGSNLVTVTRPMP